MSHVDSTDSGSQRMSRWTLCFENLEAERAFVESKRESVFTSAGRICLIGSCITVPQIALRMYKKLTIGSLESGLEDGSVLIPDGLEVTIFMLFCCLVTVFGTVVWRVEALRRLAGTLGGEIFITFVSLLWALYILVLLGALQVRGSRAACSYRKEYMITLSAVCLQCMITLIHLLLSARWCISVWTNLLTMIGYTGICMYAVMEGLGASQALPPLLAFLGFSIGAAAGLRSRELAERVLFATVIDERTLRMKAEFTADVRHQQRPRHSGTSSSIGGATRHSAATTTDSAALFSDAILDLDRLPAILDLGVREQWLIRDDQLCIKENKLLGEGGEGVVVEATFCKATVAVKTYKNRLEEPLSCLILNEIRLLRHVRHPHISLFHGASFGPGCFGLEDSFYHETSYIRLVLEKVPGLPVHTYLSKWHSHQYRGKGIDTFSRWMIVQGVSEALVYLHSRKPCIVHSDVKPTNIIVEDRQHGPFAKLLDFGLALAVTRNAKFKGGTKAYMAPEAQSTTESPGPWADVYSFGRFISLVATGTLRKGSKKIHWPPDAALVDSWDASIQKCTARLYSERPKMEQVHDEMFKDGSTGPKLHEDGSTSFSRGTPQNSPSNLSL